MPSTQIPNPANAFAPYFNPAEPQGVMYIQALCASAVSAGQAVCLTNQGIGTTSGTLGGPNVVVSGAVASSSGASCIGVALDTALTGAGTRIIIAGLASATAAAALTVGTICAPTAAGCVTGGTATTGGNIGYVVVGTASTGPVLIFVDKM